MFECLSAVKSGLTLTKLVQENNQRAPARLYLHPDDRMSNPISSNNVKTNNVVLQIVVPKRTGLKRRRGALGPYHEGVDELGSAPLGSTLLQSQATSKKIPYLLRSLRDNTERYKIQPFGSIHITHRFRGIFPSTIRPGGYTSKGFRYARLCLHNRK